MKLNARVYGEGQPLVVLHGLFGSSDNWQTLGKRFAEHFEVHLLDQRNHGRSDHDSVMNYEVMAADLEEYMEDHFLRDVVLVGHSMGGKTAMVFAQEHPYYLEKLVIVDIGPREYEHDHDGVLAGLNSIDLSKVKSRKEATQLMSEHVKEKGVKQFLLKNLYWKEKKQLTWRMNLPVLEASMDEITAGMGEQKVKVPSLFIRGENSHYILDSDIRVIKEQFLQTEIATIQNAGHWVHAEKPNEFFSVVMDFAREQ